VNTSKNYHQVNSGNNEMLEEHSCYFSFSGADPGFQVRGAHLKKIALSGWRRENFWSISCEKSRFYTKKMIFFPIAEGGAKIFGVFRVKKSRFYAKKSYFFQF
jgi:hypothetical protein